MAFTDPNLRADELDPSGVIYRVIDGMTLRMTPYRQK